MKSALLRSFITLTLLASSQVTFAGMVSASANLTRVSFSTLSGSASGAIFSQTPLRAIAEIDYDGAILIDPSSDGVTYDALFSESARALAANLVISSQTMTMANSNYTAEASTASELIIELTGTGRVMVNLAYELLVSAFSNDPSAEAEALFRSKSINSVEGTNTTELYLTGTEVTGNGIAKDIFDVHTLTFDIDTNVPIYETISLDSFAGSYAKIVVPGPATIWLLVPSVVGLILFPRKK